MTSRLIRWGKTRAMPWRNGGGATHEIAVHPRGAALDDFDWRISMAKVTANGPFSQFEGIDRTLCLLDGAGIALSLAGGEAVIDPEASPFTFAGDPAVAGRLLGGPILALNMMSRRSAARHMVTRITVSGRAMIASSGPIALICRDGAISLTGVADDLRARDCLMLDRKATGLTLDGRGTAFIISLG